MLPSPSPLTFSLNPFSLPLNPNDKVTQTTKEGRSSEMKKRRSSLGDSDGDGRAKRTRYHRHTPQQIQELEAVFKGCPHPDEKQRWELSKELELDPRQVKFWFQNRRTQTKTQHKRKENTNLRGENEKLRAENMSMREAARNPVCRRCGGPAMLGEFPLQQLRVENARLKDELERACDLARKFISRVESGMVEGLVGEFSAGGPSSVTDSGQGWTEIAVAAMDELMKVSQLDGAMWLGEKGGGSQSLNYDEYLRVFPSCVFGPRPRVGFVAEVTRATGTLFLDSDNLLENLMDSNRWAEMFSGIVAKASTVDLIRGDVDGTKNGTLLRMNAELQFLSPLVPLRRVNFLRLCRRHVGGVWAVVDVSTDDGAETTSSASTYMRSRRLPSGCVVQELPNGLCKVTWVEHVEYDETMVHQLYRPLLRAGMGFGAQRWLATLRRYYECASIFMSLAPTNHDSVTLAGRRSMLKLSRRMMGNFYRCVCASAMGKWNRLSVDSVEKEVRVMIRSSMNNPGEPMGVVLSATTSVWLPVISPRRLFDFLRDEHLRSQWDILSSGGTMEGIAHVAKGQDPINCVSLLSATAMNENSSMLILQETCTDASGSSLVVYAPVDILAMQDVMSGGDPSGVALLPSGFAVHPDGSAGDGCGSLLTVAFQILVNSLPTAKLTVDSVETVNNLISCTVQKIRSALHCCS